MTDDMKNFGTTSQHNSSEYVYLCISASVSAVLNVFPKQPTKTRAQGGSSPEREEFEAAEQGQKLCSESE